MRLKLKLESYLSTTSAGDEDIGSAEWGYYTADVLNGLNSRSYKIVTGTDNESLDLAGIVDVRYLLVRSDQNVVLRINGTETLNIYVISGLGYGFLLISTSGITTLDVSNNSGETAKLVVQLGGDIE